ncbi:hypothetical protein HDU85_003218 [Gaertneriomyces sp. JEL0708]|nr:hypothetical protein HDU85_003218 [Gaertneriomyces sp. JEL0708]
MTVRIPDSDWGTYHENPLRYSAAEFNARFAPTEVVFWEDTTSWLLPPSSSQGADNSLLTIYPHHDNDHRRSSSESSDVEENGERVDYTPVDGRYLEQDTLWMDDDDYNASGNPYTLNDYAPAAGSALQYSLGEAAFSDEEEESRLREGPVSQSSYSSDYEEPTPQDPIGDLNYDTTDSEEDCSENDESVNEASQEQPLEQGQTTNTHESIDFPTWLRATVSSNAAVDYCDESSGSDNDSSDDESLFNGATYATRPRPHPTNRPTQNVEAATSLHAALIANDIIIEPQNLERFAILWPGSVSPDGYLDPNNIRQLFQPTSAVISFANDRRSQVYPSSEGRAGNRSVMRKRKRGLDDDEVGR